VLIADMCSAADNRVGIEGILTIACPFATGLPR
jgi:hypothetical protein